MLLTFEFEKETKNTVRFKEIAEETPVIGTIYIQKSALKAMNYSKENIKVEMTKED